MSLEDSVWTGGRLRNQRATGTTREDELLKRIAYLESELDKARKPKPKHAECFECKYEMRDPEDCKKSGCVKWSKWEAKEVAP